jgi:hypothetical protein
MTEAVKVPEPWERQASESEEAWLAFKAYREMPPDERLIKRAGVHRMATLSKWYRDHNWEDRCKAYDAHFDALSVEERERVFRRASKELAIDHMVALADMRELMSREFAKYLEASRSTEMHGLIKPSDLIKMAEAVVKLDRLVRGETTENVKTEIDTSKLSLDELRQLEELLTKAGKNEEDDAPPRH